MAKQDFHDFVEDHGLTFTKPPEGDGSWEYDGEPVSWWHDGKDGVELRRILKTQPRRVWRVFANKRGTLSVTQYQRAEDLMFYLVTDQDNAPRLPKGAIEL